MATLNDSPVKTPSPAALMQPRRQPGLYLALLIYLLLALAYFFLMPIFEGPDEWTHTGHIKYIAEGNGLPVMLPGQGIWGGQQPPLYYALGAILVQPFTLDGVADYEKKLRNPHASIGYALDPGNKNNYLHTPNEIFPYRGLSLTVHILRLYSMVWGSIALIFTYVTAFEIYHFGFTIYDSCRTPIANPKSKIHPTPYSLLPAPAIFATTVALFVAAQPMYAFITAGVANEPANIALSAVVVWLAQRYVLYGPTPGVGRAVALGAALGLVSLAKMTGLAMGLVAVLAFLQTAVAHRQTPHTARWLWRDGLLIGAAFLLIGGWWYWRNFQLYGDFFQRGLYKIYFGVDPQPLTLSDFIYTLRTGEVSFWATFGWLNVIAPDWVYSIYRFISRVGLVGVGIAVLAQIWRNNRQTPDVSRQKSADNHQQPNKPTTNNSPFARACPAVSGIRHSPFTILLHPLLLHLAFPLILAFSLTRLVATEGGMQGRQLLPALGSIAIVVIWGWWALLPGKIRLPGLGLLLVGLLALATWLPLSIVSQAYTPPPLLSKADLPSTLHRLDWTYNDDMKLIGVEIGAEVVRPGERVPVTVYWQALRSMETNYSVFIHLIGRNRQTVGQFNSYPALGLRPTATLHPGQIIADTYPVLVEGGSEAPTRLLVNVGLFNFNEPGRPGIPALAPNGTEMPPTVGQLKLAPHRWPVVEPNRPPIDFADNIRLLRSELSGCETLIAGCTLTLSWAARGTPTADYTVFVQLWQNGTQVAGFDAPPLASDYPTSLWAAGEIIIDPHRLNLAGLSPGQYQIFIGLYNFANGDRLPATQNGEALPDFAADVGKIEVTPE